MTGIELIFVTLLGACIGSFLNVVAYRLPAGRSIVHPPSSCPKCGHRLAWFDNVPVLGWLLLKGRCRYCRAPVSVQYPVVEAVTALLFGGWFFVCYMTRLRPDFAGPGFEPTALVFLAYLILISCLIAATLIDAKYFIIPLEITWVAATAGLILMPLAVFMYPQQAVVRVNIPAISPSGLHLSQKQRLEGVREVYRTSAAVKVAIKAGAEGPVEISAAPLASNKGTGAGFGGMLGLGIAVVLLHKRIIPRSFQEDPALAGQPVLQPTDEGYDPHQWLLHPHPRREVLKECLFLAFPILGAIVGAILVPQEILSPAVRAIGGVLLGYLGGGAVVWFVRVMGTLGFGKEAMGLGDAHLMAAVGAVCGWRLAVLAFFAAPFFGLAWALLAVGMGKMLKREVKMIPFGPHLAVGTILVCVIREPLLLYFSGLWGG